MGQPLTLDEVHVAPEDAAQVIYDLRRALAQKRTDAANARTLLAQGKHAEAFDLLRRPAEHGVHS